MGQSVNTTQGSGITNGAAVDNLRNFTENIKLQAMENGKKFDVKECVRLTSIGCTSEAQAHALVFLKTNDLRSFTDIINSANVEANAIDKDHWVNLPADDEGSNLMEIAIKTRKIKFVQNLINAGARVDIVSQASGYAPPHLAVEQNDAQLLKLLLGNRDECDVNIRAAQFKGGFTPLHIATEKGFLECMKLLLELDETDVDVKDARGVQTPLFIAVKAKNEKAAQMLIENGASLDIKAGRLTVREYFKEAFPHSDPNRIHVIKSREVMLNLADKVFTLLKETELNQNDYGSKLANFKTYMRFIRNLKEQNKIENVFDLACKKGLYEHAEVMLRKGASVNTPNKPILEAAFFGHYKMLRLFKKYNADFSATKDGTKETILHLVLKMKSKFASRTNYEKCLDELLDRTNSNMFIQMKSIINKKDDRSNTSLHYATQKWSQATVRKLLELGANIGIKNHWKELPITKIRPETLESFFSKYCLTADLDVEHEDFSLTFKYDFLAPDIEALPEEFKKKSNDAEEKQDLITSQENPPSHALPETEPLWYMSQSKEHRHLLKHPVITSFLWYKWQRIRRYFNRNLRFTILFVFLLTWYIFKTLGTSSQKSKKDQSELSWYISFLFLAITMFFFIIKDWILDIKNYRRNAAIENAATSKTKSCSMLMTLLISNWVEAVFIAINVSLIIFASSILEFVLGGLLILLLMREMIQMTVSLKRYFSSFENWIELIILVLGTYLLLAKDGSFELKKHLAAFAIVLSWAELIVLFGRHPKLKEYNIYVTMFLKVMKTFFLFFTWYSLFIIAFGLGFFILLHKDTDGIVGEGEVAGEEYAFFDEVWLSLVKTTTMLAGELEFSNIPIDLKSGLAPLAFVFFLSFVFLIVVVLANLLNGLAVSDTGIIREKAEIFSYRSQVETISTFESMLLGDPFDFLSNVPSMLSTIPSGSLLRQLYRNGIMRHFFTKIGATEILLFYKFLPTKSVTITPNREGQDCRCLRVDEMGRDIIAAAKEIVIKQQRAEVSDEECVADKVNALQAQVDRLESNIDLILKKLDKILKI